MADPKTMDLAAEVARLKDREAARDRAESARLGANPIPLPAKTQVQSAIEESQLPGRLAWKAKVERRQAIVDASIARNAPTVAKLDAKVAVLEDEIIALHTKIAERREAIRILGASSPPVEGLPRAVTPVLPGLPRRVRRERVRK